MDGIFKKMFISNNIYFTLNRCNNSSAIDYLHNNNNYHGSTDYISSCNSRSNNYNSSSSGNYNSCRHNHRCRFNNSSCNNYNSSSHNYNSCRHNHNSWGNNYNSSCYNHNSSCHNYSGQMCCRLAALGHELLQTDH